MLLVCNSYVVDLHGSHLKSCSAFRDNATEALVQYRDKSVYLESQWGWNMFVAVSVVAFKCECHLSGWFLAWNCHVPYLFSYPNTPILPSLIFHTSPMLPVPLKWCAFHDILVTDNTRCTGDLVKSWRWHVPHFCSGTDPVASCTPYTLPAQRDPACGLAC